MFLKELESQVDPRRKNDIPCDWLVKVLTRLDTSEELHVECRGNTVVNMRDWPSTVGSIGCER